jgi:serine/threonine-protein kinase
MGWQPRGKENEGQMAYFRPGPDPTKLWEMHPISRPSEPPTFVLKKPALEALGKDKVPALVVAKLTPLLGKTFASPEKLRSEAGKLLTPKELGDYQRAIERHARIPGKPIPGTFRFSHGLGVGDVNGDGRLYVICTGGWWEQPAKPGGKTPWKFHPASLGPDCADMSALDMDGDGKPDILSSSAHNYGIWWHQQKAGPSGEPTSVRKDLFPRLVSQTQAPPAGLCYGSAGAGTPLPFSGEPVGEGTPGGAAPRHRSPSAGGPPPPPICPPIFPNSSYNHKKRPLLLATGCAPTTSSSRRTRAPTRQRQEPSRRRLVALPVLQEPSRRRLVVLPVLELFFRCSSMIDSADALVDAIRAADLLEPDQLQALSSDLLPRLPDPRDLGRHLIHSDWLTAYQVNQLLLGRGPHLAVGPYVLLERLGAGGMGEVFKARHRKLLRIAALKVIGRQRLGRPNAIYRFLREVEAAARLSHPNIVAVYDAGEAGNTYYLAMEFLNGIDLGRLVEQAGPLPLQQACDYARQAALGLQHAHQAGLVHRDIKPANLFVTLRPSLSAPGTSLERVTGPALAERHAGGTVKVLDLGLVRPEQTSVALTQEGAVLGTVDYLAPEQAKDSRQVDRRADLYALGCTFYQLLAGQPPFAGGRPLDKLLRHQSEPPPPLAGGRRPDVPAALEAVVLRLLAKRPEDRFQGGAELAEALVPWAFPSSGLTTNPTRSSQSPDPRVTATPPVADAPTGAQPRRRWGLRLGCLGGLIFFLALGLLGWWLLAGPSGPGR